MHTETRLIKIYQCAECQDAMWCGFCCQPYQMYPLLFSFVTHVAVAHLFTFNEFSKDGNTVSRFFQRQIQDQIQSQIQGKIQIFFKPLHGDPFVEIQI